MRRIPPLILSLLILTASCSRNSATPPATAGSAATSVDSKEETVSGPAWYWFSDAGIHRADSPIDIPGKDFVPWTEAIRVSDVAIIDGTPSFLVNHLGVLETGASDSGVHTDPALFPNHTAGGFYRTENGIAIRLYRDSFFAADTESGIFLASFDSQSGSFSDMLFAADFGLPAQAQCVGLDRVGSRWYAAFKDEQKGKVDFTYLEFPAFPSRNPATGAYDLSEFRKLDTTAYQESVAPFDWSAVPEQLQSLLSAIPETTPLALKARSRANRAPQVYVREGSGESVVGKAWISDESSSALFADGTFYFTPDNSVERVKTMRLPALSRGYVYGDYVIVGKKLIAAWEEQRFYETGRAGLLEIPLPDALY